VFSPSLAHFFLSFFTVATTRRSYFRIKFMTRWYTNDLLKRHNGSSRLRDQFHEYIPVSWRFTQRPFLFSFFLFLFPLHRDFSALPVFLSFLFHSSFFAVSQLPLRPLEASIALESKLVSRLFDYVGGRSFRRDDGHQSGKKHEFKSAC